MKLDEELLFLLDEEFGKVGDVLGGETQNSEPNISLLEGKPQSRKITVTIVARSSSVQKLPLSLLSKVSILPLGDHNTHNMDRREEMSEFNTKQHGAS